MNYNECMEYLNTVSEKVGITPGLGNIKLLSGFFGHPQNSYKVIHIAGTNGKGSAGTFISHILSAAGLSVGRYVSPSLTCYNDKIQFVNNNQISYIDNDEVVSYISRIKDLIDSDISGPGFMPSVFEIETIMAFMAFRDRKVDYAVIECGMGGKYDATNVINHKELCVFTSISFDHTAYLGDTLAEIAEHKSGILRKDCNAVSTIQHCEVKKVLDEYVKHYNVRIRYTDTPRLLGSGIKGSDFIYSGEKWHISMAGTYQIENAALAIEAIHMLNNKVITDEQIRKGLDRAVWPGRFEFVSYDPIIIYDGAHNPQGIKALVNSLNSIFYRHTYYRRAFFGVFSDKDINKMIDGFINEFDEIHVVRAKGKRSMDPCVIADYISEKYNIRAVIHDDTDVRNYALDIAHKDNSVNVIFGSLSLYSI